MSKIKSVKYIGKCQTYDLEVNHLDHQFYLTNGLLTSNSHSVSYAYLSYQCAWLFYYHPIEWMCAVLENETQGKPEDKQKAIAQAKAFGFNIVLPHINKSKDRWTIEGKNTIIAPFNFAKGIGETAAPFLVKKQPFKKIEDLIFADDIDFRKVNKRVFGALSLCGALSDLVDERFDNDAHFHDIIVDNRPKSAKKLAEQIEAGKGKFKPFENEKIFLAKSEILGFLDIDLIMSKKVQESLAESNINSISYLDQDGKGYCWCYVQSAESKMSKSGNAYTRLVVFGANFDEHEIYLFGADPKHIQPNKCALLNIAKSIGNSRWNVYNGAIRVIE